MFAHRAIISIQSNARRFRLFLILLYVVLSDRSNCGRANGVIIMQRLSWLVSSTPTELHIIKHTCIQGIVPLNSVEYDTRTDSVSECIIINYVPKKTAVSPNGLYRILLLINTTYNVM